jgi:hypothetical protein
MGVNERVLTQFLAFFCQKLIGGRTSIAAIGFADEVGQFQV